LIFGFDQLAQEGFRFPKVPSSVGAHQSRIPGDIQPSKKTKRADIERTPLSRHRCAGPDQGDLLSRPTPIL
jgi:hypothetical protein